MAKELIVSVNGREKKIAIIENEKVTEFYIERGEENQGIVGNIYKGRVMRVLPGMQSAFVDIGLERDAFLYVSDFFDEEEEFERIVIDKSKKGEADVQRAAAEQIALARVEREHQIEATQERAEPLLEVEQIVSPGPSPVIEATESTEAAEGAEGGRRRGRRGRRRGRRDDGDIPLREPSTRPAVQVADIKTPFVAGDPSIQRIVDEEEATAVNGEMFKDARLQERIFDQIHAVEFDLEDDFRTAEVGSLLPSGASRDASFQRVDDSDEFETSGQPSSRMQSSPVAAHLESFVDEFDEEMLRRGSFERVSDEEDSAQGEAAKRSRKASEPGDEQSAAAATVKKRRTPRKSSTTKSSQKKSASKKPAKKKPAKAAETEESYEDGEARVTGNRSRGELATRRGGRRRRRPVKPAPASGVPADANGKDEEIESSNEPATVEVSAPPVIAAAPQGPRETRDRDKRHDGRGGQRGFSRRDRHQPAITDLLREGQEILVQIAKEPIAKKGARITSHIALPGRFLVYMPTVEHVGVSRKIESDSERQRLRKLIQTLRAEEDVPSGGFIVRTAGVGIAEKDLREDVRYLVRTWLDIRAAAEKSKPASLVHRDLDLVQRILRDQLSDDFAAIRVDSEEEYEGIVEFVNRIQPRMVKRVKLYTRDQPILENYGVQAEIDKAIKPRVWLKSGGYLVINQTEALVAIDVNTGKFVGRGSGRLEDTITRTNLEAVDEIVRQIRLRDLGGIIVLDLIDMEERRNRTKVMQALQDALRNDKSPTKVLSFNDFGLVIMTRKRVKQSLERTLCSPCQYCQGAGLIKSSQTVCYELLEEARRLGKGMGGDGSNKQTTLRIHPEVAKALRGSERDVLNEIEEYLGPVDINSDPTIHQEQYDFAFI
jgi:ribonuclease G